MGRKYSSRFKKGGKKVTVRQTSNQMAMLLSKGGCETSWSFNLGTAAVTPGWKNWTTRTARPLDTLIFPLCHYLKTMSTIQLFVPPHTLCCWELISIMQMWASYSGLLICVTYSLALTWIIQYLNLHIFILDFYFLHV